MRESRDRRSRRPTVSQDRGSATSRGDWRTLRDASELTGIPIGTLRKWCRRDTVDSYLESDGELTLRMVEMGSVRARSEALHGSDAKGATGTEEVASQDQVASRQSPVASRDQVASRQSPGASSEEAEGERDEAGTAGPPERETMIVPVAAWDKMLSQLGNLHEAGQQLAEARERAAKAETEALFLRERLAEMREAASSDLRAASSEEEEEEGAASYQLPATGTEEETASTEEVAGSDGPTETVSFWRYVARGWKGRRR